MKWSRLFTLTPTSQERYARCLCGLRTHDRVVGRNRLESYSDSLFVVPRLAVQRDFGKNMSSLGRVGMGELVHGDGCHWHRADPHVGDHAASHPSRVRKRYPIESTPFSLHGVRPCDDLREFGQHGNCIAFEMKVDGNLNARSGVITVKVTTTIPVI